MENIIIDCHKKLLNEEALSREEAVSLLKLNTDKYLLSLMNIANSLRLKYKGNKVDLCALVNAKSGHCSEDCKFCAQSSHHNTETAVYPLIDVDTIVTKAREAKELGTHRFCIVTSGDTVTDDDFEQIIKAVIIIRNQLGLEMDCSLGSLSEDRILALKNAGVTRYNHNIETSPENYKNICSTHTFDKRLETVTKLKKHNMERCCGGIIGMGETHEDLVNMAFALKENDVECVPVNILNSRPGTPLENCPAISPLEILKIIAVFRMILPKSTIKVAGGRESNLRSLQAMSFMAGANGMIINGYLTTTGQPVENDFQMLKDLNLETR